MGAGYIIILFLSFSNNRKFLITIEYYDNIVILYSLTIQYVNGHYYYEI